MTDKTEVVAEMREQHRMRQDFQRAEQRLTLQAKAICRRLCEGDKAEAEHLFTAVTKPDKIVHPSAGVATGAIAPLLDSRATLTVAKREREKAMEKLVKSLPVWPWAESVKGFGALGLAQIVGEAGDLADYRDKGKLYKRLGLAVIQGGRQRRVTDAELAAEHGYNPTRRSIVYVIGDSLIKVQGDYRRIYLERMAREVEKADEEGLIVATTTKQTAESWVKRGLPEPKRVKSLDASRHRGAGHIHNRAKRYMEKALIRDLWSAWRWADGTTQAAA